MQCLIFNVVNSPSAFSLHPRTALHPPSQDFADDEALLVIFSRRTFCYECGGECPVFSCIRKLKVVESQMVKGMMLLDTLIKIEHRKQKAAAAISHHPSAHRHPYNQNSAIVASFRLRMANSVGFMVFD